MLWVILGLLAVILAGIIKINIDLRKWYKKYGKICDSFDKTISSMATLKEPEKSISVDTIPSETRKEIDRVKHGKR